MAHSLFPEALIESRRDWNKKCFFLFVASPVTVFFKGNSGALTFGSQGLDTWTGSAVIKREHSSPEVSGHEPLVRIHNSPVLLPQVHLPFFKSSLSRWQKSTADKDSVSFCMCGGCASASKTQLPLLPWSSEQGSQKEGTLLICMFICAHRAEDTQIERTDWPF